MRVNRGPQHTTGGERPMGSDVSYPDWMIEAACVGNDRFIDLSSVNRQRTEKYSAAERNAGICANCLVSQECIEWVLKQNGVTAVSVRPTRAQEGEDPTAELKPISMLRVTGTSANKESIGQNYAFGLDCPTVD